MTEFLEYFLNRTEKNRRPLESLKKKIERLRMSFGARWSRHSIAASTFSGAFFFIVLTGSLFVRPVYQASTQMLVDAKGVQDEWDLLKEETAGVDFEEQILSQKVLGKTLVKLGLFPPRRSAASNFSHKPLSKEARDVFLNKAVKQLRQKVSVERLKHSSVLRITAKSHSAKESARIANAVAESFADYRRSSAMQRADTLVSGMDVELGLVQKTLERKVALRAELLSKYGWDDYESDLKLAQDQVDSLKHKIQSIETHQDSLNNGDVPSASDISLLSDEPALRELAVQLAEIDVRLSQAVSRYKSASPFVLQAEREKEAMGKMLAHKLENRHAALGKQLLLERERLKLLKSKEPEARSLDIAIAQANRRYQELLDEQAKAKLSRTLWKQSPGAFEMYAVLDKAIPPASQPIWMQIMLTIFTALVLSLISLLSCPFLIDGWEKFSAKKTIEPCAPSYESDEDPISVPEVNAVGSQPK